MGDVLGFAKGSGKASTTPVITSSGSQKNITAIQKNAGVLADVVGQGPDASYSTFVKSGSKGSGGSSPKTTNVKQNQEPNFKMPKANAPASAAPAGLLGKLSTYGKAFITSPGATVKDVVSGQGIKAVDNGAIIVNRAPQSVTSQIRKQQAGKVPKGTPSQLDHVQPLEIGGDNNPKNLKLITKVQDDANNGVENYLGGQLKANVINAQQAKQLNADYKAGKISAQDVYNAAKKGGKAPASPSLTSKFVKGAENIGKSIVEQPINAGKELSQKTLSQKTAGVSPQDIVKEQNIKLPKYNGSAGVQAEVVARKMVASGKQPKDVQTFLQKTADAQKTGNTKLAANLIATASLLVGGDEAKAAVTGAKAVIKPILTNTAAGAVGSTAAQEANNTHSSAKQLLTAGVEGAAGGALLTAGGSLVAKGVSKVVSKVVNPAATKDLITNAKTRSLLNSVPAHSGTAGLDANTEKALTAVMTHAKAPKSVTDQVRAQVDAQTAHTAATEKAAANTQKTVEANQKLDNQIELINAKKADGKFTNVDKVKVKQLEAQKQPVEMPTAPPKVEDPLAALKQEAQTVYRGVGGDSGGGNFYSTDKEFARNFTGSGQDHEIQTRAVHPSHVLDLEKQGGKLPSANSEQELTQAIAQAKQQGYGAIKVSEGKSQPPSIFVIDPKSNLAVLNKATTSDPLSQLKQEALKHKSADEFAQAQLEKPGSFQSSNGTAYSLKQAEQTIKDGKAPLVTLDDRFNAPQNFANFIDEEYAKTTDITKPGIAVQTDDGLQLIDGWHRYDKARAEGKPFKVHVVPENETNLRDLYNQAHAEAKGAAEAPHPAVQTIQDHMQQNYTPASDHPNETFAADHLQNNTDQALKDYQARTEKVFGSKNIVGGDDAKYTVPGMSAEKSVQYHEPASEFAKGYYKHLLADPSTKDNPVLITAGGTGAGKTSALKKDLMHNGVNPNDYAAIVDTNLTSLGSAVSRIEPALSSGRPVKIQFVYRDPVEAFENGVIPRAAKEGRAVTAADHANTHAGSIDTIKQLADKYKDNPNVDIQIIDNSRGHGLSKPVTLDFLHDKSYTKVEIEAKIHELLDRQLREGKLTDEQHTTFKGQEKPAAAGGKSENTVRKSGADVQRVERRAKPKTVEKPKSPSQKPVEIPGKTRTLTPSVKGVPQGTSKVAQRVAADIKRDFGEQYKEGARYDKISIQDQADKATKLIASRDELDKVISGEKPLPDGLRATSVITAIRHDAELAKDGDLLRRLASSPLASESSYSAQELRLARENAKNDPVSAIKQIADARKAAAEKRLGKPAAKAVSDEVRQIRAAKPKTTVTKETWGSFIDSLKCS